VRSILWKSFKSILPIEGDTSNVVFCALSSVILILISMISLYVRSCAKVCNKIKIICRHGLNISTWPHGYGRYVMR
jgi:hypothetical protein